LGGFKDIVFYAWVRSARHAFIDDDDSVVTVDGFIPERFDVDDFNIVLLFLERGSDICHQGALESALLGGDQNSGCAFITTAHRGQNSPIDPELTTASVGRADVWVFNATDPGTSLGGDPIAIVTLFGDTPWALTVSPDGNTVYAAVFKSGNRTTTLNEGIVCNGGQAASRCTPDPGEQMAAGGLPNPSNQTIGGVGKVLVFKLRRTQSDVYWLRHVN